jgi:hypothetical protein
MALTLAQGTQLIANVGYRGRIKSSLCRNAYAMRLEAQGGNSTNTWVKRRKFATSVLNSPEQYVDSFVASFAGDGALSLTWYNPVSITSSTNANPTVFTTSAVHGLVVGDIVEIVGHVGNTAANGVWTVSAVGSTTTFTIPCAASGVGTATGTTQEQESDVTVNVTVNNILTAMVDLNPVTDA